MEIFLSIILPFQDDLTFSPLNCAPPLPIQKYTQTQEHYKCTSQIHLNAYNFIKCIGYWVCIQ